MLIWLHNGGYILINYLRSGLPSKIYSHAFSEQISRYEIAKRIYTQPMAAHISENVKKMIKEGYLIETPKGIFSNVKPLLDEIKKDLAGKDIELTESEKNELFNFLNTIFRQYMAMEKPYLRGDINAYELSISRLGMLIYTETALNLIRKHENFLPMSMNLSIDGLINELPKDKAESLYMTEEIKNKINEIHLSDKLLQKLKVFIPKGLEVHLTIFDLFENPEKKKEKKNKRKGST
jgi:hypothetical protein